MQPVSASSVRLCLWSGPRNVSTALMYSFAQRSDTFVVDEPMYAHFLRVSGAQHPDRECCIAAQDTNGERVVQEVILGPCETPVFFMKLMAHHMVEIDYTFMKQTKNLFLIRDPEQMLPSLQNQVPEPRLRDTGLDKQCELFDLLRSWGQSPAVIDSRELLLTPRKVLQQLCKHLEIASEDAMLSWPAGPKEYDGVWAPYWYQTVHCSTGFIPYQSKKEPFPEHLKPLLEECAPLYQRLLPHVIRA